MDTILTLLTKNKAITTLHINNVKQFLNESNKLKIIIDILDELKINTKESLHKNNKIIDYIWQLMITNSECDKIKIKEDISKILNDITDNIKIERIDAKTIRYTSYHENKTPNATGLLVEGAKQGMWITKYTNDVIRSKINYVANILDGPIEAYSEQGELITKGQYSHGKKQGIWLYWVDNCLKHKIFYDKGKKDGICESYDEFGTITEINVFKNGIETNESIKFNKEFIDTYVSKYILD